MRVIYSGGYSLENTCNHVEVEHMERLAAFNSCTNHVGYSQKCQTCGKTFVGADWRFAYSPYCSQACELAQYEKIHYSTKYAIKLFWRDFDKYFFRYLEDLNDDTSTTRDAR